LTNTGDSSLAWEPGIAGRENPNPNPGRVKNTCQDGGYPDRCFRNLSALSEEVVRAKARFAPEKFQKEIFAPLPAVLLAGLLTRLSRMKTRPLCFFVHEDTSSTMHL